MTTGTGIFERALGADFARLHPQLQRRFGVGVDAGYGCIGRGVMSEVRRGPWWTLPFLLIGTFRNILFPERGRDVPFPDRQPGLRRRLRSRDRDLRADDGRAPRPPPPIRRDHDLQRRTSTGGRLSGYAPAPGRRPRSGRHRRRRAPAHLGRTALLRGAHCFPLPDALQRACSAHRALRRRAGAVSDRPRDPQRCLRVPVRLPRCLHLRVRRRTGSETVKPYREEIRE